MLPPSKAGASGSLPLFAFLSSASSPASENLRPCAAAQQQLNALKPACLTTPVHLKFQPVEFVIKYPKLRGELCLCSPLALGCDQVNQFAQSGPSVGSTAARRTFLVNPASRARHSRSSRQASHWSLNTCAQARILKLFSQTCYGRSVLALIQQRVASETLAKADSRQSAADTATSACSGSAMGRALGLSLRKKNCSHQNNHTRGLLLLSWFHR